MSTYEELQIILGVAMLIVAILNLATRESHQAGAGNGGRTRITSLEGWCTAVMPYPQYGRFNQRPSGIDSCFAESKIGADGGS